MSTHELTVTGLDVDTINVTQFDGVPRIILGSRVEVRATNGETSVYRSVPFVDCPRIGDIITVEIDEDAP